MNRNLFTIELEDLVAPKQVMLDQARYLGELSQGTLTAAVETSRGNPTQSDYLVHVFRVLVPALNYGFKLFEVTHSADIYPVKLSSGDWTYERSCDDFESFVDSVATILNDPATKKRFESLKCQVLAESGESDGAANSPPQVASVSAKESTVPAEVAAVTADHSAAEAASATSPVEPASSTVIGGDFAEWTKMEFNSANVEEAPAARGGAVIFSAGGSPLLLAYSTSDIRSVLQSQLAKRSGEDLSFECGQGESEADIESMVKSRVGGMQFRRLRADPATAVWP